ncbi:unnamed protein product [Chironomus riparius]|uniref:Uncharacterized protein n=1 Tax=Chironomus riparius TaxID=315576 RepID=A0A9N9WS60_9DIPT|nr:unnamed protein product [Chironomus riparius]
MTSMPERDSYSLHQAQYFPSGNCSTRLHSMALFLSSFIIHVHEDINRNTYNLYFFYLINYF